MRLAAIFPQPHIRHAPLGSPFGQRNFDNNSKTRQQKDEILTKNPATDTNLFFCVKFPWKAKVTRVARRRRVCVSVCVCAEPLANRKYQERSRLGGQNGGKREKGIPSAYRLILTADFPYQSCSWALE